MTSSSTDLKLEKLKQYFPEIEDDMILLEILISCNGSLKQAQAILSEQFNGSTPNKKRSHEEEEDEEEESVEPKRQSSISAFMRLPKRSSSSSSSGAAALLNKSNTKTIVLYTKEDVESSLQPYVTYHDNFIPAELADRILRHLLAHRDHMHHKKFYIHGKPCHSNHKSGAFTSNEFFLRGRKGNGETLVYNGEEQDDIVEYNDDLRILQMLIEDQVRSVIDQETQSQSQTPFFKPKDWKGDFALCNYYETKTEHLDWHSDRLSNIGPLPIIASFSLGATREFKLRKNHPVKQNPHPIYSLPLVHNTLIIMHSGTQEEYKHCVSASAVSKNIDSHPISGQIRFNLTLRDYTPGFYQQKTPSCKCGMTMILRRSFKDVTTRGKYFWMCNNVYQNKDCGQFYYAKFDNDKLYTTEEKECSVWIADDDYEKFEYLKENNISYDKEKGVFIYL